MSCSWNPTDIWRQNLCAARKTRARTETRIFQKCTWSKLSKHVFHEFDIDQHKKKCQNEAWIDQK
jgi:hypothetical protein